MKKKKIRVYFGIDPTGIDLHLGHAVPLRKLRQFQDLGHEVILLFGTFTGLIGDPSGKDKARTPLSLKEVRKNMASYKKQAGKILDLSGIKIKNNGDWLSKLKPEEFLKISSYFTTSQLLERDMFQKRLKKGEEVWVNELLYPLMQGYDSVAMDVDLEIGATDQTFNMLIGRRLQKLYHKREKTNFGIWGGKEYIPQNYDEKFHGEVTLREALAQSLNIPAVKVLVEIAGIEESVAFAKSLGITTLRDASFYGPALVLGGGEVRLLDIVSAYGVFAADGKKTPPLTILEIKDVSGNILEKNSHTGIQIMSPSVAKEITSILSDNNARAPLFGIRSPLYIEGFNVAAKTGTTQEYKDAWTIGYTKDIVAGVWAGNNDNTPSNRQPGSALASPLWNNFMVQALLYLKASPLSASTL